METHGGDSDPRAEFAGRWLNRQTGSDEFSILAWAEIGHRAAVVVRDGGAAVIATAERVGEAWRLDQIAASYQIEDGPFAACGAFGPGASTGWYTYAFGRLATTDTSANLVHENRVEPLHANEDGFFFELRNMERRGAAQLQVEMNDSTGRRRSTS